MLWRWREQCNSGGAACGPVLFHRGLLQQGSRDHRLESDQNRRVHSGLVSHAGQHAGHTLKGSLESHRHRQACGRLDTHAPPPAAACIGAVTRHSCRTGGGVRNRDLADKHPHTR